MTNKKMVFRHVNFKNQNFLLLMAIFVICAIVAIINPKFLTGRNIINLFQTISIVGILSLGVGVVILTGNIDLSIANMVSFLACLLGRLLLTNTINDKNILFVGLLLGMLCGCVNGIIVAFTNVDSFIITLACASVYYGLALLSSDGYDIFITNFQWFGSYRFFDVVPIQTVLYVTLSIIMALVMRYTTFGRSIYAVGGNAEAAYVSGINVKLHKLLAYIICGMLCSISAMIILSKLSGANATMASGYDMDSITACVVGGISLIGGRGDIFGCFLGVLLMGVISNALNIMAVPVFYQEIISGCVLLMAVILRSNPDYKKIIKRIRSFVAAKSLKSE